MQGPDISVVIPTYNRKEYLEQAVSTCFRGNESIDVEVVVVDDGSTDGTRTYLEEINDEHVRTVLQENSGGQIARNRGLSVARGEYVKFLDDDDWLRESALETEYSALRASGADVSYGTYDFVRSTGTLVRREEAIPVRDPVAALLTYDLPTHPLRFTYRRAILSDVKWDPGLPCRQDVDFILRVATKEPEFIPVSTVVGYFRQHEGPRISNTAHSSGVNPPRIHASILKKTVKRMREEGILDEHRKEAAARGLWTWAHLLSVQDFDVFREIYDEIEKLRPSFCPYEGKPILNKIYSLFGVKNTEYVISHFR